MKKQTVSVLRLKNSNWLPKSIAIVKKGGDRHLFSRLTKRKAPEGAFCYFLLRGITTLSGV